MNFKAPDTQRRGGGEGQKTNPLCPNTSAWEKGGDPKINWDPVSSGGGRDIFRTPSEF